MHLKAQFAPGISRYFLASELSVFFLCKHTCKPTDQNSLQLASWKVYQKSYLQFYKAHGDDSSRKILCI